MTISGALNNAMSGLRAAGRGTQLVSSNISNALTPGYGRRELALSASAIGDHGGVRIDGITRVVNEAIASDRRLASAENGHAQITSDFFSRIEKLLGTPDDAFSISSQMSGFENSLITSASRPDAPERLSTSIAAARSLVTSLQDASKGIQDARSRADTSIGAQIDQLNLALQQVQKLNSQITSVQVNGGDSAALLDQRQQVVDQIGAMVPVRSVPRDNGQIALYTEGGAILIDGQAAEIGFDRVNLVTPYMSIEGGSLSGLTINGNPVRTGSENGVLRGGTIGAQFAIRDEEAPAAQAQIDALARDLVERFQDPAVDPSLTAGDAGLFTDNGFFFDPLDEVGLSERLVLNAAVDPSQGGQPWRLRDGINAATPGNSGDATLLNALRNALNTNRVPASGDFGTGAFSAINLISTLTSQFGTERFEADQMLSFASARFNELTQQQLADGVDTDAELQQLMLLEQAYAANARVIETVDEMMQTIMRL